VPALLWQTEASGREVTVNSRWLEYTGQTSEETQHRGWLKAIHPEDRATTDHLVAEAFRSAESLELQHRIRGQDSQYRWFLVRQIPSRDTKGRIVGWFGAATDVHELHQLQERQGVLVAELQHRTRNLIAVVRSIANQTMAQASTIEVLREQFNNRLAALSRVQGLLSRADQEPITLRALLKLELDALGAAEGERIRLNGPFVRLRPSIVQTLALALHELATNARKYGALSDGSGRLDVAWHLRGVENKRRLFIEWREEGLTRIEAAQRLPEHQGGYGRQLIERALPYALQAETTFDLGPSQLRCTIDLPLDRTAQAGGG
jgi:PAS domain S-box-containing protein